MKLTEKHEFEHGTIYQGDCLKLIKDIPDKSVDCIITDPPYNIRLAEWDIFESPEIYNNFIIKIFSESLRILKDSRHFIFFHNNMPAIAGLMNRIKTDLPLVFRSFITWHKNNYRNQTWMNLYDSSVLRSWMNSCEYIVHYEYHPVEMPATGLEQIFSNPECFRPVKDYLLAEKEKIRTDKNLTAKEFDNWINQVTFTSSIASRHYFSDSQWCFPTEEKYLLMQSTGYFQKPYEALRQEYEALRQEYEALRQEYEALRPPFNKNGENYNNFWTVTNVAKVTDHPAEKPVSLLERLIKTVTHQGYTVFDPFIGSGSIAVACYNTGRRFIGMELDPEIYNSAVERIKRDTRQLKLFAD